MQGVFDMTINRVYQCARCGRPVVLKPIEDASGNVYGATCAKAVGVAAPAKEKTAPVRRRRVARADQQELFEVGAA